MAQRSRGWRRLVTLLLSLLLLIATLAAGATGLLATEPGFRWLVRQATPFVPGELTIESIQGAPLGPLRLTGLSYRSPALEVTLTTAEWDWRWQDLIDREVHLARLAVNGLTVVQRLSTSAPDPAPPAAGPLELPELELPVTIRLADVRLEDAALQIGSGEPLRLERLQLAARWDRTGITLDPLELAGMGAHARASGTVQPIGAYPLTLRVTGGYHAPEALGAPLAGSDLAGQIQLDGDLQALEATVTANGTRATADWLRLGLSARAQDVLGDVTWQADLNELVLAGQRLDPVLPPGRLSGSVRAAGDRQRVTAQGDLRVRDTDPALGAWDLATRLQADLDALTLDLERLRLAQANGPGRAQLAGTVGLGGSAPRLDLSGDWHQLAWPLDGPSAVASPTGALSLTGHPEAYRVRVETRVEGEAVPPGDWQLALAGDTEQARLESLTGALLGGTLALRGEVGWAPAPQWDLELRTAALDPGRYRAGWDGSIDLQLTSQGRLAPTTARRDGARPRRVANAPANPSPPGLAALEATITLEDLAGRFRGQALDGGGRIALREATATVEALRLQLGEARLTADGPLAADGSNLALALEIPRLGALLPAGRGEARLNAQLQGTRSAPRLTADWRAHELRYSDLDLAELTGSADLSLDGPLALQLKGTTLRAGDQAIQQLAVDLAGTRAAHTLTLDVKRAPETLGLTARGGLSEAGRWAGRLTRLELAGTPLGDWRLERPTALAAGADGATLEPLCLVRAPAAACLDAQWSPQNTRARVQIAQVPLAWATPFLPPEIDAEGRANLAVVAAVPEALSAEAWQAAVADVALQLPPGRLRYTTGGKTLELPHEGLQLDAVVQPGASLGPGRGTAALPDGGAGPEAWAGLEGVVRLDDGNRIAVSGRLPEPPDRADPLAAPVTARVAVGVERYRLPPGLVPGVTAIRGGAQSDLRLRGSLARPRLDGQAQLTGAIDGIEALGVDVPGYELTLTGRGDRLTLAGWIDSESGRLDLDGQVALDPERGWPARVRLRGERVRVANRMEYRASISPDLTIETSPERIAVQGELAVPRLLLEPQRLPKGAQKPSEDIVIVDNATGAASPSEPTEALPLDLDLRLRLGDRVRFRGFGLDAELGGDLRLIQKPTEEPIATGQLTIRRGTYQAYGQDLTVRDGRIFYAGTPVDNPGLDLRATRTIERDDVTVGAHVTGVAQDPKLTLFSEPTLGQSDILAYLVTGRPLRQASQEEGEQLSAAATALGAAGGLLAQDIRRRFGFETLEFEGGDELATSAVVLGRYLTPRLYLSYGLNFRGQTESVGLEYQLDEDWTLETSTGQDQTGGDLIYTIEVD